jgi:hypothetical protein
VAVLLLIAGWYSQATGGAYGQAAEICAQHRQVGLLGEGLAAGMFVRDICRRLSTPYAAVVVSCCGCKLAASQKAVPLALSLLWQATVMAV